MCQFDDGVDYVLKYMADAYNEVMDCYGDTVYYYASNVMPMHGVNKKFEKLFLNKLMDLIEITDTAFHLYIEEANWRSDYFLWRLVIKLRRVMDSKFRTALMLFEQQKHILNYDFYDLMADLLSMCEK